MGWGEKLVTLATGKNKVERLQERAANVEIRKQQNAAYYQAKQKEDMRVAQFKAKAEADARIRNIQSRYSPKPQQGYNSPFGPGLGGLGGMSPITGARLTPQPQARPRVVYRYKPGKRTAKRTRRRVRTVPARDNYKPYSIWG
jgi:hypothetical protein